MNRRKAIRDIAVISGAVAAAGSGAFWLRFYSKPDIAAIDQYKDLINEMAEVIIPETDTPGARSAGAGAVVITLIKDCSPRKVQNRFLDGLRDVEDYAHSKYGKSFAACDEAAKKEITGYFERRDRPYAGLKGKISRRLLGDPFFVTMKKYTVRGYCTSRKGATQGLAYDYIPGHYSGVVPLKPGQKCWAT